MVSLRCLSAFCAVVALVTLAVHCNAAERGGDPQAVLLSQLKEKYGVAEQEEPQSYLQGLRFDVGDIIGDYSVSSVRTAPFDGVRYSLAESPSVGEQVAEDEGEIVFRVTVRAFGTLSDALNHTLVSYGVGFAEAPRRGRHQGQEDIGDFSLVSRSALFFVRKNISVLAVSSGELPAERMDAFAVALATRIDEVAEESGVAAVSLPELDIRFADEKEGGAHYRCRVSVVAPDDVDFDRTVVASSGRVTKGDNQDLVEWDQSDEPLRIKVSAITRDGFVFIAERAVGMQKE